MRQWPPTEAEQDPLDEDDMGTPWDSLDIVWRT